MHLRFERVSFMAMALAISLMLRPDASLGASMPMGNIMSDTMLHKKVESIRERRYRDLIEQETDFSCGAASLATILKYAYQRDEVTEVSILEGMMKIADPELVRVQGFSLLDLKNYVEKIGFRGRGYEVAPDTLDSISIPVVVLLDIEGYKHFVVMKKASGDRIYVGDPALGNRVMSREDFMAAWNNIIFAVVGDGYDRNNPLLKPSQPLTAHRMRDVFAPVSTQNLIDFGFRHADLM